MSAECKSCSCELVSAPRRQWVAAALLAGLTPWKTAMASSGCGASALRDAQALPAPRDVCVECLLRRAQQRSPFVNREVV